MKKVESMEQTALLIKEAAQQYKTHLVGRSFLYVIGAQYIKVLFRSRDFLHLTGVDTALSANSFYQDAVKGRLRPTQFSFSDRHPYDLSIKKLHCLRHIETITNSPSLLLSDINTVSFCYRYGLTEKTYTLCLHADVDLHDNIVSDHYIPRSLRSDDSRHLAVSFRPVDAVFAKRNDEKMYHQLLFLRDGYSLRDLPQELHEIIAQTALTEHISLV